MNWNREKSLRVKGFVTKMNSDAEYYDSVFSSSGPMPMLNVVDLDDAYMQIRKELLDTYYTCREKVAKRAYDTRSQEYGMDLEMGLKIYSVLHSYGMTPGEASDREVWLYFNRYVIPDIVADRFGKKVKNRLELSADRFYENSRRYYPSMLWWFVHLSWVDAGDFDESLKATGKLLRRCQSDDISQLIERAGRDGYPVRIYNAIMHRYCEICERGEQTDGLLSRCLQLNLIRMTNTEPELAAGGVEPYVDALFRDVI